MSASPLEFDRIQEINSRNQAIRRFIYCGSSMAPTFRPGQVLNICLHMHSIAPGDIIVFHHRKSLGYAVHRVIAIKQNGYITRGDNNLLIDPDPILPDQIVGRVESIDSNDRIIPLPGGWSGRQRAHYLRGNLFFRRFLHKGLSRPYHLLKSLGFLGKLWKPEIIKIRFETHNGPMIKYVHNGKTVANYWIEKKYWWYKKPYDLIIQHQK